MWFMLRNILDTLVVCSVSCQSLNKHLPLLPVRSHWTVVLVVGQHSMGKDKGIARGDKKDNISWDLFVEGWSTSERRNNSREAKADLGMAPSVRQSCLVCVCWEGSLRRCRSAAVSCGFLAFSAVSAALSLDTGSQAQHGLGSGNIWVLVMELFSVMVPAHTFLHSPQLRLLQNFFNAYK